MYGIHSTLFDYSSFLESTNISKIEISDNKVLMTFRNSDIKFICANNDKRVALLEILNFGTYEEEELLMQLELIEDNFNVLDIGANYGWYCIHVAKRFPSATIHSFEPLPVTFHYLLENIKLNGFSNIITQNIGLSDSNGSFSFFYNPFLSVNASLQNLSGDSAIKEVLCIVETLDKYCLTNDFRVDFIKCDVEGAELLAFKGGVNTIKKNLPIISSEMLRKWTAKFNYHPNEIIDFLSDLGYQCFTLEGRKLKPFGCIDENTIETNYLFMHHIKHIDKIGKYSL